MSSLNSTQRILGLVQNSVAISNLILKINLSHSTGDWTFSASTLIQNSLNKKGSKTFKIFFSNFLFCIVFENKMICAIFLKFGKDIFCQKGLNSMFFCSGFLSHSCYMCRFTGKHQIWSFFAKRVSGLAFSC